MYSFNSRIRYSELNHQKGTLACSSIINYFQDCSTFHTLDLNRGLHSENRLWLLNSWQLKIFNPAPLGDSITIGTWPYDFKGFYGYRNFIMKNEKEKVLAVANSIWVYIDTASGKPVRIPKDYAITSGYGIEPPYPMDLLERKIEMPENYSLFPSFLITKSNIDTYNHVNNGQYIKLAEEYLPDNLPVQSMRAEYRMQAILGDVIVPMVSIGNEFITIALADESNRPYAIIEFLVKTQE